MYDLCFICATICYTHVTSFINISADLSLVCLQLGIDCRSNDSSNTNNSIISTEPLVITDAAAGVGALGRVLLVRTVGFESPDHFELLEELESGLCEQMDWLLCGGGDGDGSVLIDEPVLICFQTDDELTANLARLQLELDPSDDSADGGCARYLTQLLTQHVQEYELASPILSCKLKDSALTETILTRCR